MHIHLIVVISVLNFPSISVSSAISAGGICSQLNSSAVCGNRKMPVHVADYM